MKRCRVAAGVTQRSCQAGNLLETKRGGKARFLSTFLGSTTSLLLVDVVSSGAAVAAVTTTADGTIALENKF
jgi:hypothetical protein